MIDRDALERADMRALLMCLVHLSGDIRWIEPPYLPARDVDLIADPTAGFDAATRSTIVDAVAALVGDSIPEPVLEDIDDELLGRMMSVYLGEEVPGEYLAMIRADMGLETTGEPGEPAGSRTIPDVFIVGAGVSGICLANRLIADGVDVRVIDRNRELGGTWHENRYPGCGVDTPNHFYSYSFAPNPHWSRYFSHRAEIQQYLTGVAQQSGVTDRLRLGITLEAARWEESQQRWRLHLSDHRGDRHEESAAILVLATGHFSEPKLARFAGDEDFAGDIFHSARWPDTAEMGGRRVGIIGTGASAMQIVPTIADEVEHLTIFQRTPQWVRPIARYRDTVDPSAAALFEHLPWYAKWYRFGELWRYGDGLLRFLRRDPDWNHGDRSMNRVNDRHRAELSEYIASELESRPHLIDRCTPHYPPFGKRILLDNGWYETLCRDDVELVTDAIDRFEPDGVVTTTGERYLVDTLIIATGFDVMSLGERLDVVGRDARSLAGALPADDPRAYLGMCVAGLPNLFIMYGPNTNLGHGGSVMWMAETQSAYIRRWVRRLADGAIASIEVRPEVVDAYTARVDELHDDLVWAHPAVETYYRTPTGKVRSPMPFRLVDYWQLTRRDDVDDFDVRYAT